MARFLTYRYAVNDLKIRLKQSFPDADVNGSSILFWCISAQNLIMQRHLKVEPTGAYLSEFYGTNAIPVNTDGVKKWITLPIGIFDLVFEKGIDYISYNNNGTAWGRQTRFQQTDAQTVNVLYYTSFELPTPSNPYFYRVNNNIYFLGIENIIVPTVNLGVYASLDTRPDYVNIDSLMAINDEQYPELSNMVMNLGKFVLLVPRERVQSGADDATESESYSTFTKATQKQPTE